MSDKDRYFICRLEDLADPGSRGKSLTFGDVVHNVFVVRRDDRVYGYINRCPHTGGPLDWVPGRFLSLDNRHIQCATHDALFRLDNGICIAGPCTGDRLETVALQLESGNVFLLADRLAP
ncbi:MAG: Rieske 2Fe-2S domain-containing protein [Gammaproteobacteria bacterium]